MVPEPSPFVLFLSTANSQWGINKKPRLLQMGGTRQGYSSYPAGHAPGSSKLPTETSNFGKKEHFISNLEKQVPDYSGPGWGLPPLRVRQVWE